MIQNTGKLAGLTLFITGASRGLGKAVALKAAKDGANIVLAAKTAEPHPKLPGTIYTAAKEIEESGGRALPCVVDVRSESDVKKAVEDAVNTFGGIDILINNASAISPTSTLETSVKKFDLMNQINSRGTFLVSKYCIPHLKKSKHPHILNVSPPLKVDSWLMKSYVAYSISKFGMSMCALGMAEELKEDGIACNAVWPRRSIYTSALVMLAAGDEEVFKRARKPEFFADAVYAVLSRDPKTFTGNLTTDENILNEEGIHDFSPYAWWPGDQKAKPTSSL